MEFEVDYEKILETKQEAAAVLQACKTTEGQIDAITVKEFAQNPPFPFDLGAMQSEAYRIFRYTPMRTSSIAQHLYLNALISYPRTSSQKLPPAIGYGNNTQKTNKMPAYSNMQQNYFLRHR